ncbi:hypothetical protein Cni_G10662 [Canna indica]|uniref:Uncharacterized protein n=1 Tax=Canna indica TaxID=4628 RepID=A0AAQ3K715_9LILI|nr:hypothetical protein Cni_G10662 [Canna indica]
MLTRIILSMNSLLWHGLYRHLFFLIKNSTDPKFYVVLQLLLIWISWNSRAMSINLCMHHTVQQISVCIILWILKMPFEVLSKWDISFLGLLGAISLRELFLMFRCWNKTF